jgi:uncharacterized protein involved in type VI secretion and phage assembly
MDEQLVLDVLDRVRNRFYGKYRGTVTEIEEATLRIKAKVPAVLGEQATGWCRPCVPYAGPSVGFAFLPEAGTGVWIEFEAGDVSYPIWSGCYWRDDEQPSDAKEKVKVLVTVAGHSLTFDDDAGTVTITDSNDNTVTMDSDGLTLERSGKKVVVASSGIKLNDSSLEVT